MQEKAINLGCMELLEQYIQTHHSDDTMCQMALMCVGSLADSGEATYFVLFSTCMFFRYDFSTTKINTFNIINISQLRVILIHLNGKIPVFLSPLQPLKGYNSRSGDDLFKIHRKLH